MFFSSIIYLCCLLLTINKLAGDDMMKKGIILLYIFNYIITYRKMCLYYHQILYLGSRLCNSRPPVYDVLLQGWRH